MGWILTVVAYASWQELLWDARRPAGLIMMKPYNAVGMVALRLSDWLLVWWLVVMLASGRSRQGARRLLPVVIAMQISARWVASMLFAAVWDTYGDSYWSERTTLEVLWGCINALRVGALACALLCVPGRTWISSRSGRAIDNAAVVALAAVAVWASLPRWETIDPYDHEASVNSDNPMNPESHKVVGRLARSETFTLPFWVWLLARARHCVRRSFVGEERQTVRDEPSHAVGPVSLPTAPDARALPATKPPATPPGWLRCPECGYVLFGIMSSVCPECGLRLRLEKDTGRSDPIWRRWITEAAVLAAAAALIVVIGNTGILMNLSAYDSDWISFILTGHVFFREMSTGLLLGAFLWLREYQGEMRRQAVGLSVCMVVLLASIIARNDHMMLLEHAHLWAIVEPWQDGGAVLLAGISAAVLAVALPLGGLGSSAVHRRSNRFAIAVCAIALAGLGYAIAAGLPNFAVNYIDDCIVNFSNWAWAVQIACWLLLLWRMWSAADRSPPEIGPR